MAPAAPAKQDLAAAGALLLVGCGKMGGALLDGWLAGGADAARIVVVEPAADPSRVQIPSGVSAVGAADAVPAGFQPDVVIMAVKPQMMAEVAPAYRGYVEAGAAVLSIAAGTNIAFFEQCFGPDAAVVRVMPNTPAAVGRGMSVLCANAGTSAGQRELCTRLMAAVGETAWLDDEGLMDAVTAVSGSGPAYVFLLIECLAAAGAAVGLPAGMALKLARETVAGAGELARSADEAPSQLRVNVTSPGGTTEAALKVLMAEPGLQELMTSAVTAAERRGRELGS